MARIRKALHSAEKSTWHIALYIRLSKEDGNDESLSIGNQRKILLEYVRQNFEHDDVISDVYIDDGKTGTDVNRPDFMRMEQDIRLKKVNCVIVKSLARAFRNLGDQQKYLEEFFPLHGVRFINIGTPFIDTHKGAKMGLEVPIHGMFNEQFAASTSEEVRKTFNTKRREGEFIGAFAPYGYQKHPDNKNALVVDEEAAAVVRDIFNWYLYGIEGTGEEKSGSLSANGIARELNERGVPCPAAYKKLKGLKYQNPHNRFKECYWQGTSVARILKDRVYTGCMVQGKFRVISYKIHKQVRTPEEEWFVVENTHEAIIAQPVFDEVQCRLGRDTRTAPGKKELHLFSGFLQCAGCGRSLHRKTTKSLVYYFCRTPQLGKDACTKRSIRESALEEVVLSALRAQIALADDLATVIDRIQAAPRANSQFCRLDAMRKHHESELLRLTKVSDALYMDWKNGDLTREEYLRMKTDVTDKADELHRVIEKLRNDCSALSSGIALENPYFTEFQQHRNIGGLRRGILVDLIDVILLSANGELTVKFNFADPYQRFLAFAEDSEREPVAVEKAGTASVSMK